MEKKTDNNKTESNQVFFYAILAILCGIFVENVQNSINLNYYQIRILCIHFKTPDHAKRFILFQLFLFHSTRNAIVKISA